MRELWYRQPAKEWEEALPLGNGRIGAMVFGNMEAERIQVNEESVWYGGHKERINPDARQYLPQIRRLIREGHISEAQTLMETTLTGCPNSENPYQTLGDVRIYFKHDGVKENEAQAPGLAAPVMEPGALSYRRSLSLSEGVCRVSYRQNDTVYEREYFVSRPADCMVMHFQAKGEGRIHFTLRLDRWYFFKGVKKSHEGGDASKAADGVLLYGRPGEDGYAFTMMVKGRTEGGSLKVLGESLIVEGAREVTLCFGAVTQFRWPDLDYEGLEKLLCDHLEQVMRREYASLLEEHVRDHRSLFDRVELRLGPGDGGGPAEDLGLATDGRGPAEDLRLATDGRRPAEDLGLATDGRRPAEDLGLATDGRDPAEDLGLPTDERLLRVKEGKQDTVLEELLFDYGRYLMIAGSRPGTLPTTLQGLWNQEFMPPWGGKYTININTEMNYWPAEVCNLSECHLPLFDLIKRMVPRGRQVAREMYGCRGFMAHHNTDIHGDCAPQDLWMPATYWPMGAAWLCTHLWTHYVYTLDEAFLREAFPIMAEAALYFVDALEPWGDYCVTNPSSSPENTYILPNGDKGCICMGPTMDSQILRDLFTACLKSYELLGSSFDGTIPDCNDVDGLMGEIRDRLSKLVPTRIGSDGRIMEWLEEYEEEEPGHRHVSQLYGLYPSDQISVYGTPELAAAAKKTLEARLSHGGGHTGWSRAWIMNHYAKLWDGERAHENILQMLTQSTYPNLFDRHPPFQIDGNFGATAAIAQMLVQSGGGTVFLLPALPKAWREGSVRGLCLPGNARIDISWKEDGAVSCQITCLAEHYQTKVRHGEKCWEISLSRNEKWTM